MKYKNLFIYFFSGTGNAKRIAEIIHENALKTGVESEIFSIQNKQEIKYPQGNEKTLIGICTPTHGFNIPPNMIEFVLKFPKVKNCEFFIVNTRGGMKVLNLYTPGLSGIAQYFPAFIMRLKAIKTVGWQPMDMPSNWISLHPGIRKTVTEKIVKRCEAKTKKFTEKILSGKKVYTGFYSLPFDLAIMPVSVGYYFFGRFFLAKTFISTYKCNNCGLCEKQCPVQAIKNSSVRPYWTFHCESCMRCMNLCPHKAIETPHAFVFVIWFLIFFSAQYLMLDYIAQFLKIPKDSSIYSLIYNILLIGISFAFVWISYKITNFLMRFKIFNFLIAFTSLTKIPFWRRYKIPKK